MDGWWRGGGDDDGDDLLRFPVPAGCQNGVLISVSEFLVAAAQRNSSANSDRTPLVFRSKGLNTSRRGAETTSGLVSPPIGAARVLPRLGVVRPPPGSARCPLLAPEVLGWNRIFGDFSRNFPESWFSAQKRDTKAILLKTASVRVSCIQNTQIRGQIIRKVFGKVDTFWTYQLPPSLAYCLSSSNSVENWERWNNFHEHFCFIWCIYSHYMIRCIDNS